MRPPRPQRGQQPRHAIATAEASERCLCRLRIYRAIRLFRTKPPFLLDNGSFILPQPAFRRQFIGEIAFDDHPILLAGLITRHRTGRYFCRTFVFRYQNKAGSFTIQAIYKMNLLQWRYAAHTTFLQHRPQCAVEENAGWMAWQIAGFAQREKIVVFMDNRHGFIDFRLRSSFRKIFHFIAATENRSRRRSDAVHDDSSSRDFLRPARRVTIRKAATQVVQYPERLSFAYPYLARPFHSYRSFFPPSGHLHIKI